ncbi:TVP38/TMEM64 family protein [Bacillus litorisediminis]|uniref:hypothetical protein n=1 Tax=Bacillus litorisediminis TaxID=2922713 RepID=UPI001FAD5C0A|nr:hypothetical protein [Bacillus litorisediminis]
MSTLLNVCGTFVIVIGFISGIISGSFLGFIFGVIGSVVSSILFFALAKISDVQETILFQLQTNNHSSEQLYKKEANKVCVNCDYRFNSTMSSCPNCGYRR